MTSTSKVMLLQLFIFLNVNSAKRKSCLLKKTFEWGLGKKPFNPMIGD